MRKTIFVFISFFVLFSCTTENELVYQEHSTTVSVVNKRSLAEALEIAQEAISLLGTQQSRSGDIRTIDMKNVQYLSSNKNSRSQNDDTLLYVINYADDKGFAVVSANPNTTGLIAVTEKGTYSSTSEDISNNDGMKMFMDMAKLYVSDPNNELERSGPVTMLEVFEKQDTIDTYILPKLTTKWGQTYYEGAYCPNGYSGCGNTALAQIMAYFEYPTQMDLTYENAPTNRINLDWTEIKKYEGHFYNDMANEAACRNIGYLCRQLGELTHSTYGTSPNATATFTEDALEAMSSLGYFVSSEVKDYNKNNFLTALSNNNLIYMRGEQVSGNNTYAHAWVIDGHYERKLHYMRYVREPNSELWTLNLEQYIYFNYNHINWGLDGSCNGYFINNVFNMANGFEYDNSYNVHDNLFTLNLKYFLITKL